MSLFVSKPALIDDCETQIAWNGIEAITSNGEIEDLYSFHEALKLVGSSAKLSVIEKAVALYESVHQRRPNQDEAIHIGCEHASELNRIDSEYYKLDEDLEKLCLDYVLAHPDEITLLKMDEVNSSAAEKLLGQLA